MLVVFDLDGTLVDTLEDITASVNRILTRRGREALPVETVRGHVGHGVRHLIRGSVGSEDAIDEFLEDYGRNCLVRSRAYPGVTDGLDALGSLPMVVASNKPTLMCGQVLDGLGLGRHFLAVYGGDSFPVRKPDPGVLREICTRHGVSPGDLVMVGDSQVDLETARGAGARFCAVQYGYGDGLQGVDWSADSFQAVVGILLGSPGDTG